MEAPTAPPSTPSTRPRKSRWEALTTRGSIPGIPLNLPVSLSKDAMNAFLVRTRIEEIGSKLISGHLDLPSERDRSPSPPPVYDKYGKRVNTREQRARDRLLHERHSLIERAIKMNPSFKPPADFKPISMKRTRKIFIPVKQYPHYNFIGRVIGPRGTMQKRLEQDTGTRIAVRGKGSIVPGRVQQKSFGDENEELHVLITADNDDQLERASAMIEKLLVPVDDANDPIKKEQLEYLARLNGTHKTSVTSEFGKFETGVHVSCQVCGQVSHPSSDCSLRHRSDIQACLDLEVDRFMKEIADDKINTDALIMEFMSSLPPPPSSSSSSL